MFKKTLQRSILLISIFLLIGCSGTNQPTEETKPTSVPTLTEEPTPTPEPTKTKAAPSPTNSPIPTQEELTERMEWLVTKDDLESMYGEINWVETGPQAFGPWECMIYSFQSWSINPDNILNCVYTDSEDVQMEEMVDLLVHNGWITDASVKLESSYSFEHPFMLYGTFLTENGHTEYAGYLFVNVHMFYIRYDTGTQPGETPSSKFNDVIDKMIYDILMLNLERSGLGET